VREVPDESHQVFRQLLALIKDLPDDTRIDEEYHLVWLNGQRFPAGEFFDHFHDDHESDVRAWLARALRNNRCLRLKRKIWIETILITSGFMLCQYFHIGM
jgi:hypothetical protein